MILVRQAVVALRALRCVMLATLLAMALALAACGGALAEGKAQFDKGRYPEAKHTLVAAEPESRTWSDTKRAEYALYRGLTHGALGDRPQAGVWLRECKAIEDAHPGSLSAEDAQRLKLGLDALEGAAAAAAATADSTPPR
jgi:hypothetical protein